jgi:hypothetical protein
LERLRLAAIDPLAIHALILASRRSLL